jgi:hypothetical protein
MYWFVVSNIVIATCGIVCVGCMWKHFLSHGVSAITYLHEKKVYLLHINFTNASWIHTKLIKGSVYSTRDVLLYALDQIRSTLGKTSSRKNTTTGSSSTTDLQGCYVIDYIYPPHKTFTRFLTLHYDPHVSYDIHDFKRVKWIHVSCNHTNMTPYLKSLYVSPHIKLRHLHLYLQQITGNFNLSPMYEVITRTLDDALVYDMNSSVC